MPAFTGEVGTGGAGANRSHEQLVDDLSAVILLMQSLEDELVTCQETLIRHGTKLQNLDIAMQMVRAIAHVLQSDLGSQSQTLARLEDLRFACAQALGTP